ncbi:hypothetical protein J45TS6_25120 [Paenibacillus sp. J45TS6]|uniref:Uncharacterized protein n=1 Tax=Paenibacillus polygoni TaxID=3050112 RepID=A0ABY8XAR6_9BACL|nr:MULTISPECIES: hypothetical protein [Paenibacillus]WIV20290.1 hypothetical protein QPK24_06240 [Paenibacillus polygoni]GIP44053.1 hypothetical protein J45TS6_25120 [Paenibacillus sp. J45TS6]
MNENYTKIILTGILLSLLIIAFKPNQKVEPTIIPPSNVTVSSNNEFIQISSNIIGVKDDGTHSGIRGQLLVFEYNNTSKLFEFKGSLNYEEYINHPEKYGIAVRK